MKFKEEMHVFERNRVVLKEKKRKKQGLLVAVLSQANCDGNTEILNEDSYS